MSHLQAENNILKTDSMIAPAVWLVIPHCTEKSVCAVCMLLWFHNIQNKLKAKAVMLFGMCLL